MIWFPATHISNYSECIFTSCFHRFRYSEDDVVSYVVQILQGLDYLHTRRILHLDIKPENVIVTHMNVIKIIDFGSAQTFNPLFLKQFSPPIGTLEYMCKGPVYITSLLPPRVTQSIISINQSWKNQAFVHLTFILHSFLLICVNVLLRL